jgi:hypothetical protein
VRSRARLLGLEESLHGKKTKKKIEEGSSRKAGISRGEEKGREGEFSQENSRGIVLSR